MSRIEIGTLVITRGPCWYAANRDVFGLVIDVDADGRWADVRLVNGRTYPRQSLRDDGSSFSFGDGTIEHVQ